MHHFDEISKQTGKSVEVIAQVVERAKRSLLAPAMRSIQVIENGEEKSFLVRREGVGPLVTHFGPFEHFYFHVDDKWQKYSVLVSAKLTEDFQPIFINNDPILLRIDSGCETGQLFGDLTCECRDQLDWSIRSVAEVGNGMIINVPSQDGRGMGLPFKLATLRLQTELGVDTVQASTLMQPRGARDLRTYGGALAILKFFGIPEGKIIRLMSNNPKKTAIFKENGYLVEEIDIVIPPTEHTHRHLIAKQNLLGHRNLINLDGAGEKPDE